MPGKRSDKVGEDQQGQSSPVGFFFSPIVPETRTLYHHSSKQQFHKKKNRKFAQTNFRIVLNQLCDVKRYLSDPEKEVVWDDVASLQCCKEDGDCCPICLMEYSVPRATKCGHIFCLGCILYYFRQQNSEYTKCPMCSEIIGASSLRPVTFFSKRNRVKEGAKTTMELVVRHSTCVNAFSVLNPRLQHYLSVNIPSADAPIEDISFCHYLVSSPSYELNCAKDELKQLQKAESDMDCAGEVLMKGVVEMVRCQLNEFIAKRTNENENGNGKKEIEVERTSERNGADLLYYYTIPSNLSYHLLPLCFRCLCSFFGGYNDLPPLIAASVNQIDDVEFVVDGRKDIILNHMPAFSIVHWVELNVLSVIPGRIDASLFDKLKKREHARKKAKQQMKREDQRIRHRIEKDEKAYLEQCFEFTYEDPEEMPNPMDCHSFPFLPVNLPSSQPESKPVVPNKWRDNSAGVIGMNTTLKKELQKGRFPTLSEAHQARSADNKA